MSNSFKKSKNKSPKYLITGYYEEYKLAFH